MKEICLYSTPNKELLLLPTGLPKEPKITKYLDEKRRGEGSGWVKALQKYNEALRSVKESGLEIFRPDHVYELVVKQVKEISPDAFYRVKGLVVKIMEIRDHSDGELERYKKIAVISETQNNKKPAARSRRSSAR